MPDITYDLQDMDVAPLCRVIQTSYWGKALSEDQIAQSFAFSSCVGLLQDGQLIAFARAVSDRFTCAHVKDVIVLKAFQHRGFGRMVLQGLFDHPHLTQVPSWYLGTKDAHVFYERLGFKRSPDGLHMHRHIPRPT